MSATPDPKLKAAADAFIAAQVREGWAAESGPPNPTNRSKPAAGIRCPKCGAAAKSWVWATRHRPDATRRFRVCLCGKRFRTTERVG